MQKNDRFKHLKTWYHYFITLLVIQVFFCVQFKNPVDPAFKGSYDFRVDNFKSPVVLSIFQPCTLYINDSLSKDRYNSFSCYVKKDSVACVNVIHGDTSRIQIVFYKPCTTNVVVKGIHPNGNMDERMFENVAVLNPYLINGNDTISKNDTIELSIARSDSGKDISTLISNVRWSDGKRIAIKDRDSTFTIQCDNAQSDSTLITATLIYDDTTSYTLNKKITFKGWSPRIKTIGIKSFNPDDTGNIISQTDSFKVKFTIDDPDTNTTKVEIIEGTTTTIGSVKLKKFSGTDSITLPPITKSGDTTFLVRVFDNMGYTDDSLMKITVREFPPEVFIKDTIRMAFNSVYKLNVKSKNCTGFRRVLYYTANDSTSERTDFGNWELKPFNSPGIYILKVTPLNESNKIDTNKVGKTITCVIIAKKYNYQTFFKRYKDTVAIMDTTIKVNRPCTLSVCIKNNEMVLEDTGVVYNWSNISDTLKKSYAVLNFKDSVQPLVISVNGIVNGDTAWDAQLLVNVRLYRPQFTFIDSTNYHVSMDSAVHLKYEANPNSEDSTPVSSVYYRIPALSDSSFRYDSVSGIRFSTIGNFIVEMWCVDRDSIKSIPDTAQVEIYSDLPVISLKSPTIEVALNEIVTISGIQTKPGRDGKTVDSILYDCNKDGIYDVAVKVGGNNTTEIKLKPYTQLVTDTITFICKDITGKFSSPVKQYINVFSSIPKIESCQLLSTSTKYKSVPVNFKISITDPDDSLLHLKVFANGVAFDSLDSVGNHDTISLKFNTSGTYRLQFVAVDSKLHESDTLSLDDLLVIDPGKPVITAFNIKDSLIYINDTIRCIPAGIDNNGTIKKYLYYINDTNSNPVASVSDTLKYAFADSGRYVIYTRIIDNDTLSSAFAADTVVVRRGQPVVEKFSPDSSSVFVNDSMSFSITVSEPNGRVIKREIDLNGKIIDSTLYGVADTIKSFKYFFTAADSGWNILKMRVLDDDNIYSEWKECSLYVNPGVPVINTISIDPSGVLFVRDTIMLSVSVSDINNVIKSVKVLWNTNGTYEDMVLNTNTNKYQKEYQFKFADSTMTGIRIKVTDTTGFSKDSLFSFSIRVGRPAIDSISPSEVWIKDTNTISIVARDTNDMSLDSFSIKLNNNEQWRKDTNASFKGIHFDDTNNVGIRQIMVRVMDKDSLWTEKNCNLNVKIGRPIVRQRANSPNDSIQWVSGSSGKLDTMFFRWTGGFTSIAVGDTDLNGDAVEYYWTWGKQGLISPSTLVPEFQRDGLTINDTNRLTVSCKDNDSVRSNPYTFFVFPDGPPDVPIVYAAVVGDSIEIYWSGRDLKDGIYTNYKVLLKDGESPSDGDFLVDFTIGTSSVFRDASGDGYQLKYKFKMNSNTPKHIYHYQVIARDARGSIARSSDQNFPY